MIWDDIKREVITRLTEYIQPMEGEKFQETVLAIQVDNAMREVAMRRRYPKTYSQTQIDSDMTNYISTIYDLALYDYSQIGMPFESSHSENGTSRGYFERAKLLGGVTAMAKVI